MKRRFNFALAGGLLCLSLLAIVIFRTLKDISIATYIAAIAVYSIAALGCAVGYIVLNKGLAGVKVTSDMLPKEWDADKKKEFIKDLEERRVRSKKLLLLLIPIIATFFFEIIDIYFLQNLLEMLGK